MRRVCVLLVAIISCSQSHNLSREQSREALSKRLATDVVTARFSEGLFCTTTDELLSPNYRESPAGRDAATASQLSSAQVVNINGRPLTPDERSAFRDAMFKGADADPIHRCFPTDSIMVDVRLKPEKTALSQQWKAASIVPERRGLTTSQWLVPIAVRDLVVITGVSPASTTESTVEFTWRWRSVKGDLFVYNPNILLIWRPELRPLLEQSPNSDNILAFLDNTTLQGSCHFRLYDDGWRLVPDSLIFTEAHRLS